MYATGAPQRRRRPDSAKTGRGAQARCWSRGWRACHTSAGAATLHRLNGNTMRHHRWYRATVVSFVLSGIACAVWFGVRAATLSIAPSIHVRWISGLPDEERHRLEDRFQLVNPEHRSDDVWAYDLLDSRTEAIRALVQHPAVRDTHELDRERFTVSVAAQPGDASRWLWHRWGTDAAARKVQWSLAAWFAASVVAMFIWRLALEEKAAT